MIILAHISPKTLEPYRTENLGILCSPRCVYADDIQEWPWAADNDAYAKWDEGRYRDMLARIRERTGCLFVTAPDVVGDWKETTRRFLEWRNELDGLPVAFVAQDDQERHPIAWDAFDALFIGGAMTTDPRDEWKMGPGAARLIAEAKERGKHVHMGRVNTYERMRYARWLGCDTVDGAQFSWFRDVKLPPFLRSLEQGMLEGTAT